MKPELNKAVALIEALGFADAGVIKSSRRKITLFAERTPAGMCWLHNRMSKQVKGMQIRWVCDLQVHPLTEYTLAVYHGVQRLGYIEASVTEGKSRIIFTVTQ